MMIALSVCFSPLSFVAHNCETRKITIMRFDCFRSTPGGTTVCSRDMLPVKRFNAIGTPATLMRSLYPHLGKHVGWYNIAIEAKAWPRLSKRSDLIL